MLLTSCEDPRVLEELPFRDNVCKYSSLLCDVMSVSNSVNTPDIGTAPHTPATASARSGDEAPRFRISSLGSSPSLPDELTRTRRPHSWASITSSLGRITCSFSIKRASSHQISEPLFM